MRAWSRDVEKFIESRTMTVMQNPMLYRVMERFGAKVFRRSSIFHGIDEFMAEHDIRGSVCFEVGSWNGLTAIVLSRYFERVISVDIAHNPLKHEITAYLGIRNIRFFDIRDNADKAKIVKEYGKFDCAYLDGDHANDTRTDFGLVKHCGRVIFHEFWPCQPPVWKLVHSLPKEQIVFNGDGLAYWNKDGIKAAIEREQAEFMAAEAAKAGRTD